MQKYQLLIGGRWVSGNSEIVVKNPYDGTIVGSVDSADLQNLTSAVESSDKAFKVTRELSAFEKSSILMRIARGIETHTEDIARTMSLESGKPLKDARIEVSRAVNTFTIASEECKRFGGEVIPLDLLSSTKGRWGLTKRFPVGPTLAISPFNFPLNLIAHKVAPAIAVGNPVLIKPSSATPMTAFKLAEIILESGLPPEAISVVPCRGSAIEAILPDERLKKLSFTGSPEVGWRLKSICGKMKITLELGGNAAVIIDTRDHLKLAAARSVIGAYAFAGQICISIQRIIVREDLYDEFIGKFTEIAGKLKLGNPLDESTDIGPMIDIPSAEKAEIDVKNAVENGAKLIFGGNRKGTMFNPTLLSDVPRTQPAYCSEIFAPVAVVSKFSDFNDALDEVNDSIYGLQAGVFTDDINHALKAFERLEVGGVMINEIPTFRIDNMPYGGVKNSGYGREGVVYAMEEMTEMRLLTFNPL